MAVSKQTLSHPTCASAREVRACAGPRLPLQPQHQALRVTHKASPKRQGTIARSSSGPGESSLKQQFEALQKELVVSFANPKVQTLSFGTLSASSAILAAGCFLIPSKQLFYAAFPEAEMGALDPTFLQIAGATLVISSAVEYCLKDSAENGRLSSATYQRLMVGCIAKGVAYLLAFYGSSDVWSPLVCLLYPTGASASIVINAGVLYANNTLSEKKPASMQVPIASNSWGGWIYSVFALVYLGTALACWLPPGGATLFNPTVMESPEGQLIKHSWAPGFLLAAVACVNLKDAADRRRLGASTFKRLNLGLAGTEFLYSIAFISAMVNLLASTSPESPAVSNLFSSLGIAAYCFYKAVSSKK